MAGDDEPALFVPAVLEATPEPPCSGSVAAAARRRSSHCAIELTIDGVVVGVGADTSSKAIAAVIKPLKAEA